MTKPQILREECSSKDYILSLIICLVIFGITFYGNEYLAGLRKPAHVLAFEWERRIPYIQWFFIIYFGIFFLPAMVPVLIKKKKDLFNLTRQIVFVSLVSGLIFFFYNTHSIYPSSTSDSTFETLKVNITGRYNLFPSLHVAFSLLLLKPLRKYSSYNMNIFFTILAVLLILSTVFTHQHHVPDIIGGIFLFVVSQFVFPYEFQYKQQRFFNKGKGLKQE
ncbi:MAG: phosphatase PAP2 family protein [Ferruginibacter sp.]